ncbi:response regulator transcription factor [Rathayibacter sp. KR2-224]|uniref:response regulator transcription factor n=1 Tax=Rathayibacter sp. KR2-224 TaxID=3400913 RepID=UPI003C0DF19E
MSPAAGRRAVVIEDDDDLRDMISTVLERAGLSVVTAPNGLDGLAAVRATDPVVITVDLKMPGISGLETITRIRDISDALIVVLSAMTAQNDEDESLQAGADVFILKPFHTRQLQERVDQRLSDLDQD